MLTKFIRRFFGRITGTQSTKPLTAMNGKRGCIFSLPAPGYAELGHIQKSFARLYATEDGKTVFDHLQRLTFMRSLQADTTEGHLRYAEGQRALVAQIMRYILAGQQA